MARTGSAAPASRTTASAASPTERDPHIDVHALAERLLGRWAAERHHSRDLILDPAFHRIEGQPYQQHRQRVFEQLQLLVDAGAIQRAFPSRLGGEDNHGGNIASFEELVLADPSLQIKSGVQWGLFGAAVLHLGTTYHHDEFLPGIMTLETPGAFAMTETGHGSDVASIATTATYDPDTEQFVLDTPFRGAWKDYIGNAAVDARAAVVFAQLVTPGTGGTPEHQGVHAFYVPIRDADGAFLPGIGGEDDGVKGGLNGIDNGRLHFTGVRIPRTNLLNRYGDVAPDGTYSSPIASKGRRFFTMIGTLVQGRVSLDGASAVASKLALDVAVRYGSERRQFSATADAPEEVLLDYGQHQRRLIPRIATTYAMSFAHEKLLELFHEVFAAEHPSDEQRQELETLAAALKPLSTWNALDILQEAREACGGAGFLAENRLTGLRADLDIYATFEGDNTVLLQLVGKRLLTDYAKRFAKPTAGAIAGLVAGQVAEAAVNRSGLRQLGQSIADLGQTGRSVEQLRETDAQRALLTDRVETMVASVAQRLRPASKLGKAAAADLFNETQHDLIEAARAHAELLQWEAFTEAVEAEPHADTKRVLTWLRDIFGLGLIERHLAWYLIAGRISGQRASALTAYIDRLIRRVRPHAIDLVDAFGLERAHVRAAIATGAEAERQREAMSAMATLRGSADTAAGRAETSEASTPLETTAAEVAEVPEDAAAR